MRVRGAGVELRAEAQQRQHHDEGPTNPHGLGPIDPSFRALSGRFKFTVRRYKFNKKSLSRKDRMVDFCSKGAKLLFALLPFF